MKVEKAGMGDIEALVKMRLCYLIEDNGSLDARDLAAIKRGLPGYFQAHLDKDLFIYVIRDGQNIVSCAFLLIVEKPMSPAFINGRTGMVLNVYTCPSHRRKGCAKRIMEALTANVNPTEIYASDDMLVMDSYFSLLHFATGEEMVTDAEWKYFLDCLNGNRVYNLEEKLQMTDKNSIDGSV